MAIQSSLMDRCFTFKHFFLVSLFLSLLHAFAGAQSVGLTYATQADNLPSPKVALSFLDKRSSVITKIRLFDANPMIMKTFNNSDLQITVGVENKDIIGLAAYPTAALLWVRRNIIPYMPYTMIRCIVVGDKLIPGDVSAPFVLRAMKNLQFALEHTKLGNIHLSTVVRLNALETSYPPSAGAFYDDVIPMLHPLIEFLQINKYPLFFEAYPFYAYQADPLYFKIPFSYALLDPVGASVQDGQLVYTNQLDGLVDALYSAIEKIGLKYVMIVVSETGWPSSEGTEIATRSNAERYIRNLVNRLMSNKGTPKHPAWPLETYIHTLFIQDKEGPMKSHFGLLYPNMTSVINLPF